MWQHRGGADFPYSRLGSVNLEEGISSPWAVTKLSNGIAALTERHMKDQDGNRQVTLFDQYVPRAISNPTVSKFLNEQASIADARGSD